MKTLNSLFGKWAVPSVIILIDAALRHSVYAMWGCQEWLYFAMSALFAILLYRVLLFGSSKLSNRLFPSRSWIPNSIVSVFYSVTILGSYGYFLNNGILPNYYTIQYLIDNPYNSYTLLSDSFHWYFVPALAICFAFVYYALANGAPQGSRAGDTNTLPRNDRKISISGGRLILRGRRVANLKLIGQVAMGGVFVFLILFFNNNIRFYDQCAVADANIISILVRTATNRAFGVDKGSAGLSSRIPPRIDTKVANPGFNVLFVVCESLRPQSMGVYGYERETTPFLSSLSHNQEQELFVVRHPFTNASTTVVSLPSLFSGIAQYQSANLLYRMPLFWDYARVCGYSTFYISSHDQDWYHLSVFFSGAADYYWNKRISGHPRFNDLGIDDKYTVNEFEEHVSALAQSGKQFAGVLHFNTNHLPYTTGSDFKQWIGSPKDDYDNSVMLQDYYFRKVFEFLESEKILDNTIVVITSDHGQAFREHNYIGHLECNYIETVSVPMMLYLPKSLQSKFDVEQLKNNLDVNHSLIDIVPTFITIFGLDKNSDFSQFISYLDGTSLFAPTDSKRDMLICNSHEISESNVGLSLVRGCFHYIFRTNISPVREELYNFIIDPWETKDIWDSISDTEKQSYRDAFEKYDATKSIINMHK